MVQRLDVVNGTERAIARRVKIGDGGQDSRDGQDVRRDLRMVALFISCILLILSALKCFTASRLGERQLRSYP
ncbi:MAG: hypothetical protein FJ276_16560 [Planctomycetes bacterium]|nr:hypothetical protein [Planctomycetota bacterium]